MDSLIDQIADAVRDRLIQQGLFSFKEDIRLSDSVSEEIHPSVANLDEGIASKIDHTLLRPDATPKDIQKACEEALHYHFAAVCVNSVHIPLAAKLLEGSSTKAITVVGFPLGAADSGTKVFEAREAIRAGAQEIDMVINLGALKNKNYRIVLEDIRRVVDACKPYPVKVILETGGLSEDEKIVACALSKAAGATFVKTSTGFGPGGATVEDVKLMRRIVGPSMGVKASGGIRNYQDALKMLQAGANRIGASASVSIVSEGGKEGPKLSGPKAHDSSKNNQNY